MRTDLRKSSDIWELSIPKRFFFHLRKEETSVSKRALEQFSLLSLLRENLLGNNHKLEEDKCFL